MHKKYDLLELDLALFDGGAAGGGGGDGSGTGGTQAGSAGTQQGNTGEVANAAKTGSDAGSGNQTGQTETPEQRMARYKATLEEFKDLHTADMQRVIDKRFKETRGLQEALEAQRPLMDFFKDKYPTAKDPASLMAAIQADESQWQAMADAAGQTVEQFKADYISSKQREKMEADLARANQELFYRDQMSRWEAEARAVKETYPDFDLATEIRDKTFQSLLRSKVPMELAYQVIHFPDIVAGAERAAADRREKEVTEAIRARGSRPAENGGGTQNAVATATDVSKLNREQRAELAKRASRGETITLR